MAALEKAPERRSQAMSALSCFRAETCQDIGAQPQEQGLDAALCSNGDFVSLCACCQHHAVFDAGSALPDLCRPWPASCSLGAPSPAQPQTSGTSPEGCTAVNAYRPPEGAVECAPSLASQARRVALQVLQTAGQSGACEVRDVPELPSFTAALVAAGPEVHACSWEGTIGAWQQGVPTPFLDGAEGWEGLPTLAQPGASLLSVGALRAGCAFATGGTPATPTCGVRVCLVDPPMTAPSLERASDVSRLPACSPVCRGSPCD